VLTGVVQFKTVSTWQLHVRIFNVFINEKQYSIIGVLEAGLTTIYVEDGAKDEKVTLKCMRKSVAWNYFEMSAATQVSNLCSKICKKVETQEIS